MAESGFNLPAKVARRLTTCRVQVPRSMVASRSRNTCAHLQSQARLVQGAAHTILRSRDNGRDDASRSHIGGAGVAEAGEAETESSIG
jgi:hypothetical protein